MNDEQTPQDVVRIDRFELKINDRQAESYELAFVLVNDPIYWGAWETLLFRWGGFSILKMPLRPKHFRKTLSKSLPCRDVIACLFGIWNVK